MTEYRKGDVCSLEVVVSHQPTPDEVIVVVPLSAEADQLRCVPADKLTLLRRAPVDLATCDLSEPVAVVFGSVDFVGKLVVRTGAGIVGGDCLDSPDRRLSYKDHTGASDGV